MLIPNFNIVIIGGIQQQAEALKTQFENVTVLYNKATFIRNKYEIKKSEHIKYIEYCSHNPLQETLILYKLLIKISPDVIYINGMRHLSMVGLFVHLPGLFPKKQLVLVTSHNSWAWKKAFKRFFIGLYCRLFADGIFTLATFQEDYLRKLGISERKIRTIHNAVDIELFNPFGPKDFFVDVFKDKNNYPIIVHIAPIIPTKGHDILIKSISLVKLEQNDVRVFFIGNQYSNSQYEQQLKELVDKLELEKNIFFFGPMDHTKIPSILRSSDILVISSWNEVCPFTLLESMAVGKVTISSSIGGIPDLISDGVNGFLFKPGDFRGLAECILRILQDEPLKMRIEKNARISAESYYSFSIIGEKHKDFISSLKKIESNKL